MHQKAIGWGRRCLPGAIPAVWKPAENRKWRHIPATVPSGVISVEYATVLIRADRRCHRVATARRALEQGALALEIYSRCIEMNDTLPHTSTAKFNPLVHKGLRIHSQRVKGTVYVLHISRHHGGEPNDINDELPRLPPHKTHNTCPTKYSMFSVNSLSYDPIYCTGVSHHTL